MKDIPSEYAVRHTIPESIINIQIRNNSSLHHPNKKIINLLLNPIFYERNAGFTFGETITQNKGEILINTFLKKNLSDMKRGFIIVQFNGTPLIIGNGENAVPYPIIACKGSENLPKM